VKLLKSLTIRKKKNYKHPFLYLFIFLLICWIISLYIIYDYYNNKSNLDYGCLVLTFDDSHVSQYSLAYPLFLKKGVEGTFYITTDSIKGGEKLNWDQVVEMHNNGMDIQCHAKDHKPLPSLTAAEVVASMQEVNNEFSDHDIPTPLHHCYPYGDFNDNVKVWVSSMRLSARAVMRDPIGIVGYDMLPRVFLRTMKSIAKQIFKEPFKIYNISFVSGTLMKYYSKFIWQSELVVLNKPFGIGSLNCANQDKYEIKSIGLDQKIHQMDPNYIDNFKQLLNYSKQHKKACVIHVHKVTESLKIVDGITISLNDLEEIIDYSQTIDLNIITHSQLYSLLAD